MSNDSSEEKSLPPSEHKLRKAREKGQVAAAEDFITGVVTCVTIAYVVLTWHSFYELFARILNLAVTTIPATTSNKLLFSFLTLFYELAALMGPLAVLITLAAVAANILQKQGIPFSLHPIKPDFSKINPAQGLKKLFSRRNAAEFATSLVKISIWFAITGLFMWLCLQTILASVHCSLGCVLDSATSLGLLILLTAIALLLLTGLLDIPFQTVLFRHEQKMGHKELKRELKDTMGAPEFREFRRHEHREINSDNVSQGDDVPGTGQIRDGSDGITMIVRGSGVAIGIFYHAKHADIPRYVSRYDGENLLRDLEEARKEGIPVLTDTSVANDIYNNVDLGDIVRETQFEKVARLLVQIKAI